MNKLLFLLALPFPFADKLAAQTINGVVNNYYKVTEVLPAKNCIRVDNSAGLQSGDKVMLVQMKGATISLNNNTAFGDTIALNNAGNYELSVVCQVKADSVFLFYSLLNTYDAANKVQLVQVPVYQDVTVTDTLKAMPWDDVQGKGGILAISVEGVLTLNAPLSVTAAGFSGGKFVKSSGDCLNPPFNSSNYFYNANNTSPQSGAFKGESVTILAASYSGGRGPSANGGGGGNNHNNAGGGGANLSAGGIGGGNRSTAGCTGDTHGLGGNALGSWGGKKIFLGGGGGAGHVNNTSFSSGGGNGGGIVFLQAANINGNSQPILANGGKGGNTVGDGASGGGAAGTIILDITNYTSPVNVEAKGGDGGDEDDEGTDKRCYGGGGGGSGGVVYVKTNPILNTSVAGGLGGQVINSLNCGAGALATGGASGTVVYNYAYQASTTLATTCGAILPLHITAFTARKQFDNVSLSWSVEETARTGILEFSVNQRDWTVLRSAENKDLEAGTFLHTEPVNGKNFYRMKIRDINGSVFYSRTLMVEIEKGTEDIFVIYPNPSHNKTLQIQGSFLREGMITVLDITGRTLVSQPLNLFDPLQTVRLEGLKAGIYFVKIHSQVRKLLLQ